MRSNHDSSVLFIVLLALRAGHAANATFYHPKFHSRGGELGTNDAFSLGSRRDYIVLLREDVFDVPHRARILLKQMTRSKEPSDYGHFPIASGLHFHETIKAFTFQLILDETTQNIVPGINSVHPEALLLPLLNSPWVIQVEENHSTELASTPSPANLTTQNNATWGLDRLDQVALPLDHLYHYNMTGRGVNVFVLDSGIRAQHLEFNNRVSCGFDIIPKEGCDDGFGHGTQVAGIVAGQVFGVAKEASLIIVKVVNFLGQGTVSDLIQGIEFVGRIAKKSETLLVAVISMVAPYSPSLNKSLRVATKLGVIFVAAAGNTKRNACFNSPPSSAEVLSVAAVSDLDELADFSARGPCVDLLAPGVNITSAWINGDKSTNEISGTSAAAAHVAGIAALYVQKYPSVLDPRQLMRMILKDAVPSVPASGGVLTTHHLASVAKLIEP